ncbi:alpha/beta fold hydrolase [Flavobacterium sp. xlx-214]|uniref:alpha/beta fold hydrolase n=1 Tax=unclassified Flavobacterium TaxID=196869 RepID=UPI0013D43055|nr:MULTISPECIES: alpha/beta fold hydrolase [unclassified Flavobacterium]MBA5792906.1 alpha/beta fold hydrolase [Flavobacterium sp. xlx-221]QMI84760.1 alpha/beta fold hydrolase [Flavobacterium sp. xlx-214]
MCLQSIVISPSEIGFNSSKDFNLTYQLFGKPLGTAPIVLVNHALTGNSLVAGTSGWWNQLIGKNLTINTEHFTILAFNIPGNGYDNNIENLITNYQYFSTKIIAQLFWKALEKLNITKLYAIIGGSLGGAIAWEMAFLKPTSIEILLPIACSYKASDWLIGNVLVQNSILNHSSKPIEDARMHAMLLYRTPESIQEKFQNKRDESNQSYQIESWLKYHGKTLKDRFKLDSYKLMNHLLKTIGENITEDDFNDFLDKTTTKIHIISVDSDYMFTEKEQLNTFLFIKKKYSKVYYNKIESIHGHDAFLIEYKQLHNLLQPYF